MGLGVGAGSAGDLGLGCAVGVHYEDVGVFVEVGYEGDLALGRPYDVGLDGLVVGKALQDGAVGGHHVNLGVAVTFGDEGDVIAVRGPYGAVVGGGIGGNSSRLA